jgi:hypothetical protein
VPTCVDHPETETEAACARCGTLLCGDCLVQVLGKQLCAACRDREVREMEHSFEVNDRLAREALIYSGIGLICTLMAPFGIVKGARALRELPPQQRGPRALAILAIVLGTIEVLAVAVQIAYLIIMAR